MQLNDEADDAERQLLLPFVARLACAETPEVEREREVYIDARLRLRLPFRERLAILEGVLAIGRQADVAAPEEVRVRLEDLQQTAISRTSADEHPLLVKVHGWLAAVF